MSPFSTHITVVADVEDINHGDDLVRLQILLSTDPGPAREFRPFLSIDLDQAHATELLGSLSIELAKFTTAAETDR